MTHCLDINVFKLNTIVANICVKSINFPMFINGNKTWGKSDPTSPVKG